MDTVNQNTINQFAQLQAEVAKSGLTTDTTPLAAVIEDAVNAQAKALDAAKTLGSAAEGNAGNLWAALAKGLQISKENRIHPAFVRSAFEVALGPTKELKGKAVATIKQYRSRFNSFTPIYLDDKRWAKATGNTKIETKDAAGNVTTKTLEGLTEIPRAELVAKIINSDKEIELLSTDGGKLMKQFRDLLTEFRDQASKRIKNQAASKDAGTPALNAVPLADMIGYLKDAITDMPERTEAKATDASDNADVLAAAVEGNKQQRAA